MVSNAIAPQRTVADLVAEYDEKAANVETAIGDFERSYEALQMAGTVWGQYVEPIGSQSYLHADRIRKNLLISGWKAVQARLEIDRIASAKDKQRFERDLANPPLLTLDNAKATFGDYLMRPRFHILKGLAEAFVDLDPAYKSHSKVKIGVEGLSKRIILTGWGEYNSGYGVDRFQNIVNALATYQGRPHIAWTEVREVDRTGDTPMPERGLTVRRYLNGNAHIIFAPATLLDINRALAEFYGEVLPDAEEEGVKPSASTAISKDLQFYWTPPAVAEAALDFAGISHPHHYRGDAPAYRVLEPSCGDGRILDMLREYGCRPLGIEYHPGRASEARQKGHSVVTANFLEQAPAPEFDRVVMNPPFYGRHYAKHVRHALKFLTPGGTLVSILPATAHYDHDELKGEWRDLPVGSFSEAGTNVPTGLLRIKVAAGPTGNKQRSKLSTQFALK
jgi:SAM-dependent methyltransferase